MSSESKLVVELWDYFQDMLPKSARTEAAVHLLRLFHEYGIEIDKDDLVGECDYLDHAVEVIFDGEDEDVEPDLDWDNPDD